MRASTWIAIGLALTTVIACVRLVVWAMRSAGGARSEGWRLAVLLAAQPLLAGLLYLTLFPPPGVGTGAGTLVAATRDAPRLAALAGGLRIDLPEAPDDLSGESAPDLATALRRHPGVTRLRILGDGLEARDREAAAGMAIDFTPPSPPAGLAELHTPERVAPGDAFQVTGRVGGFEGGSVELLDPAGRIVDTAPTSSGGDFVLTATARDAGPALFAIRVRDLRHNVIELADAPVWVAADPGPSVLLLAGAPGPETKQLRRWALDAGVTLQVSVGAGDGLELGETRPRLDAATLDRLDLVVVDDRSWAALGAGERAALIAATRGGMGLLLRVTGPVPASVREQWGALGLPLGSGDESVVVRLTPGASSSSSNTAADPADTLPQLTRRVVDGPTPGAAPLARDMNFAVLGRWRALGRGRAGVWAVTDSSGLVTAGFGARYGELWSTLFSTLARASLPPASPVNASSADKPRAGQRVSLCGIGDGADVLGPDGRATRLYLDSTAGPSGCAGYWPVDAGWRVLRPLAAKGGERLDRPFYVYPAGALPGVRARDLGDGVRLLAGAPRTAARAGAQPGPAWPWLLTLLAAMAGVWFFERARTGRSS